MTHYHAAIWIDHHEAHIVSFNPDESVTETVRAHSLKHSKHSAGKARGWRAVEDTSYYEDVAAKLGEFGEILIVGPANAKFALFKHLQAKHAALADKVIGIETVDHPTDAQVTALARNYFHNKDRMLPLID